MNFLKAVCDIATNNRMRAVFVDAVLLKKVK
jgi:hypothetical protein